MRAKMGIMMGYAQRTKGYRIWLINENKFIETINVRFDENKRGINFRQKVNSNLGYNLNLPDYYDDEDDFDRVKDSLTSRLVSKTSTETPSTSEKPDVSSDNHNLIPCTEVKWIRNIVRKVTGSNENYSIEGEATPLKSFNEIERYCKRHNIEYDPSLFNFRKDNTESQGFSDLSEQQEALMVEVTIPNCYKQAIRSRDASKWHDAMDKEINVMMERKVWDLVDHPDNIKILENRWVYTIKYDENNKIVRYKARLVARDSDFATNRDDRVSMGGFITFIDETPISWRTFKQKSVSLSTMEAEYVSLTEAAKEFIWLKNFTNKCNKDNARTHTARVAQDFLRPFQTLPWPAHSPDLSPVEHVWGRLKRQMPSCHSVHDLELAVQDLWAHLPQDNIRCLINSMPDHVGTCIAAGGGPTRY
ncbi:retrovirus-related Pol polyprotein from transposon RE1 [Trichonephila clavipes]|nr:retrovirus-related Pol polyprotein from transposon RE1 [Trichonephila clavipes]